VPPAIPGVGWCGVNRMPVQEVSKQDLGRLLGTAFEAHQPTHQEYAGIHPVIFEGGDATLDSIPLALSAGYGDVAEASGVCRGFCFFLRIAENIFQDLLVVDHYHFPPVLSFSDRVRVFVVAHAGFSLIDAKAHKLTSQLCLG